MKRASYLPPLLGLALLAAAVGARALRPAPQAAGRFESPTPLALGAVEVPIGPARLAGVVRGPGGGAVAEALVKVLLGDEPTWTYTDPEGRFALEGLSAGAHALHVWTRRFHHQVFPVTAPADDLALVLEREFGELERFAPIERADLAGELVPALGAQVVKGYEVLLLPAEGLLAGGAAFERRAEVGADRRFTLSDLILGEYRVAVVPPWARGADGPDLAAEEARRYAHTRVAAERGLSIPLARGAISGFAFDVEGLPVTGALALAHPLGRPEDPWPPAATDASGAFELVDLPPGRYAFELRAGEARLAREVEVVAGARLRMDLPPLELRRPAGD